MTRSSLPKMGIAAIATLMVTCLDTSPIEYNVYSIRTIQTPVDSVLQRKKVYIGHSLPVNVTVDARYAEEDIPLQFYLLNVDDVHFYNSGIGDAADVRVYHCYQTPHTRIRELEQGSNTYGLVINIPAEQARDELTGDFKTGEYYVVADVDANDQAELDAFKVYERFKDRLDGSNTVFVASDFTRKPDLSVEEIGFTGTDDNPHDSVTFYELDLSKLPGAQAADLPNFYIKPSAMDRTFDGSVTLRSSSADALNVPVKFFLESDDGSLSIPLEIYDTTLNGFTNEFFVPILRKNTPETVSLQFRIPDRVPDDEADTEKDYFSYYGTDAWDQAEWDAEPRKATRYPLFSLFMEMVAQGLPSGDWLQENVSVNHVTTNQTPAKDYEFRIRAEVNADGKVTESRFIEANQDNSEYTTANYLEDGDVFDADNLDPVITTANNSLSETLIIRMEKIFVEPNEGAKFYPCSKMAAGCDADDYRSMVIFWGGWGAHVGNNTFGAGFDVWSGIFFRNYSLFSLGLNLYGHVAFFSDDLSVEGGYRMSLTAESHPFETDRSFYEFVVLGSVFGPLLGGTPGLAVDWGQEEDWWQGSFNLFSFKDEAQGFGDYTVNSPVTFSKMTVSFDIEIAGVGVEISIRGGYGGIYIVPRTDAQLNRDGSLRFDVAATVGMGVEAEAGIGAFDLVGVGIEGGIDIVSFDLGFGALTRAYYHSDPSLGLVKGSIGFGPDLWFLGPQGYIKGYVELPLLFASVRIEQTLISFQAFKVKLYDEPFVESEKTGWVDLARPDLVDYRWPDLRIDE